ncbi:DNA repair protein RecO [Polaribacter ponticola]|uniref:DNA repair protein RecO n=1 Tax=Polaribacter ponticola TaxID=2978475 RepID=UPI0030822350
MAIVNTKAIVLSSLKYGDTSLIVKCYTQEEGVKSYLIKGILKPKKRGLNLLTFSL